MSVQLPSPIKCDYEDGVDATMIGQPTTSCWNGGLQTQSAVTGLVLLAFYAITATGYSADVLYEYDEAEDRKKKDKLDVKLTPTYFNILQVVKFFLTAMTVSHVYLTL